MSLQSARRRWMTAAAGAALSMLTAAGCASRGNVDALESHLRQTQDQLRRSEQELARTRSERDTARQETELVRQQVASAGVLREAILPEHTQALARIANLSINKMMSGGRDNDGDHRDEALQVIVSPLDGDGDLVKIAGKLEIEAYDLSKSGEDKRIGRWQFDAADARKHWHSGFLTSGFQFHLPWQDAPPQGKDVLVHARLTTSDGRQFDTNQTLVVNARGGDRSPIRPAPSSEPGRLPPPAALQPALEQANTRKSARSAVEEAESFQPLPQMSRPLKKTAEASPVAATRESSQADTTVEVGKAELKFDFDDAPQEASPFRTVSGETVFGSGNGSGSKFDKYRPSASDEQARPEVVPPPRDPEEPVPLPGKPSTARQLAPPAVGGKADDAPRPLPGKASTARPSVPSASGENADDAPRPLPGKTSASRTVSPLIPAGKAEDAPGSLPPWMPESRSIERFPQATRSDEAAPPFPRGLSTTSDVWTDETIPRLR